MVPTTMSNEISPGPRQVKAYKGHAPLQFSFSFDLQSTIQHAQVATFRRRSPGVRSIPHLYELRIPSATLTRSRSSGSRANQLTLALLVLSETNHLQPSFRLNLIARDSVCLVTSVI